MKRHRSRQNKGQGLPLNTVILTILVILVLIVVAAFFLGGTSNLTKKIREIFFGSISGTDRVIAVQTCQQRCDQLQLLPKSALINSAYCDDYFNIDTDNDGEAQYIGDKDTKKYVQYYCWNQISGDGSTQSLDVPCSVEQGGVTYTSGGPTGFCATDISKIKQPQQPDQPPAQNQQTPPFFR